MSTKAAALRTERDYWLKINKDRVSLNDIEDVAIEMRRLGLYHKGARIIDIRQSIIRACDRLKLKVKGRK